MSEKTQTINIEVSGKKVTVDGPYGFQNVEDLPISTEQKAIVNKLINENPKLIGYVEGGQERWTPAFMIVNNEKGTRIVTGELYRKESMEGTVGVGAGFSKFTPNRVDTTFEAKEIRAVKGEAVGSATEIKKPSFSWSDPRSLPLGDKFDKSLKTLIEKLPEPNKPQEATKTQSRPLMNIPIEAPTGIPGAAGVRSK